MYDQSGDYVRVGVNLGDTLDLAALEALDIPISHVLSTVSEQGWALWGWFTGEQLDAPGRTRNNLRRPTVGDTGFDLEAVITYCMFDVDGELHLYVIWSLWGDVNDDDEVTGLDVTLLNQFLFDQWRIGNDMLPQFNVQINQIAAHVSVSGELNGFDVTLLNRYLFDEWRASNGLVPQFNVILGRVQQP